MTASDHLPYAADAESPLKDSELAVLRSQYTREGSFVGVQTKFNYAWGLIKSRHRHDQQLGVRLLTEIFRDHIERRRECLYYLALGHYRLGNYAEARRYNDTLLENEPGNLQALSLRSLVDEKVAREGLLGVAIVGGVAVVAGLLGSVVWRGLGRKR
ncbi:putative mitochondrial fission protein Tbfis1p [Ascodesmis nigricans]|uniref:Mitochondrial fission 1 protein n=1 Tax=Ascodesmis nigricans TaxID=341454 RepID=A0A4S2N4D3_9PEZI|nr:putative mitochondrial fission protein Tbfis1p [Ascodesmis nigricans]